MTRQRAKTSSFGGMGLLAVNNNRINYRYFDDPNKLVERLALLKSAEMAGMTKFKMKLLPLKRN